MTNIRLLSALGPIAAIGVLMLCALSSTPTRGELVPSDAEYACGPANNWCAPADQPDVEAAVNRLEKRGLRCSAKPVLTDHLVFQRRETLTVEVVTHARALELAAAGAGWVQRFCA